MARGGESVMRMSTDSEEMRLRVAADMREQSCGATERQQLH